MAEDRHLGHQKGEWESLEKDISSARLEGVLSQEEASIASAVASNVLAYSHLCRDLKDVYDCELDKLSSAVKDILSLNEFPDPGGRRSQRGPFRRGQGPLVSSPPSFFHTSQGSSSPDSPLLAAQLPPEPTDHLRLWFLDNISNPYPTPQEKQYLSEQTGIVRTKIDSDLTNWRRRAGWTDIKDRWCDKDKKKMRELIEGYEMGWETRAEVINAIERMKGYLMKEKENSVGSRIEHLRPINEEQGRRKKLRLEIPEEASSSNPTVDDIWNQPLTDTPSGFMTPPRLGLMPSSMSTPSRLAIPRPSPTPSSTGHSTPAPIPRSASGNSTHSASSSSSPLAKPSAFPFQFKPYSFRHTSTPSITSSASSSSHGTIVLGHKRSGESLDSDEPNVRRKRQHSSTPENERESGWTTPLFTLDEPVEAIESESSMGSMPVPEGPVAAHDHPLEHVHWSPEALLPPLLPHMLAIPEDTPYNPCRGVWRNSAFTFSTVNVPVSDLSTSQTECDDV